jgi:hypothetical protein
MSVFFTKLCPFFQRITEDETLPQWTLPIREHFFPADEQQPFPMFPASSLPVKLNRIAIILHSA